MSDAVVHAEARAMEAFEALCTKDDLVRQVAFRIITILEKFDSSLDNIKWTSTINLSDRFLSNLTIEILCHLLSIDNDTMEDWIANKYDALIKHVRD